MEISVASIATVATDSAVNVCRYIWFQLYHIRSAEQAVVKCLPKIGTAIRSAPTDRSMTVLAYVTVHWMCD